MLRVGEGALASLRPELGQYRARDGFRVWLTITNALKTAFEVMEASN